MEEIIEFIDKEIERLNAVRALLQGSAAPQKRPKKKRTMSKEARELIAAAQRKRWAESKRNQRAVRA